MGRSSEKPLFSLAHLPSLVSKQPKWLPKSDAMLILA